MSQISKSILILSIVFLDLFLWQRIFSFHPVVVAHEYFLDVGQGDSELIIFPNGSKVLVDAGSDNGVLAQLAKVLPVGENYIDLAIISYPDINDFNGFNFVLGSYRIGAFLYNGRQPVANATEWVALMNKIRDKKIPLVTVGRGNRIRFGGSKSAGGGVDGEIDILSPNVDFAGSADLSETGIVAMASSGFKTLFTADINANVENYLVASVGAVSGDDLHANVLKVADHASKYSVSDSFYTAVNPEFAIIEFGAKNSFSKPAPEVFAGLASTTYARILETDKTGTVEIFPSGGKLQATKEK